MAFYYRYVYQNSSPIVESYDISDIHLFFRNNAEKTLEKDLFERKTCTGCKVNKIFSDFYSKGKSLMSQCKTCIKQKRREEYFKNRIPIYNKQ